MRLIVLAILVYLLYRLVKSWGGKRVTHTDRSGSGRPPGEIDDVMVKDPQCGAYFPSRKAVRARVDGRQLEFCSEGCRDRYLEAHQSDST